MLVEIKLGTHFFPLEWESRNGKYNSYAIVPGWEITHHKNCTDTVIPYLNLKYVIITTKSPNKMPIEHYSKDWDLTQKTFLGITPSDKHLVSLLYFTIYSE